MSYGEKFGYEICPVCREAYPLPGKQYCSTECLNDARRYRRRLDPIVRQLRDFGFSAKFIHGVALELTMPPIMRDFYPRSCWTFTFPQFFALVPCLTAALLDEALTYWLGKDIFKIAVKRDNTSYAIPSRVQMNITVEPIIEAVYPIETFICPKCEIAFVKSAETYSDADGCCYDCTISNIPF